uniref:Glycosyltransferase n=2 Tax=Rhizophora mucronata TaxID=61149 RepID=A0A2P2MND9_RHIMU
MEQRSNPPPHVLIFPFPIQGHVNSTLKLAELLCLAGLNITFLNSEHNHDRLVRFTNVQARFAKYPGFQFKTVPDGLPADNPRTGFQVMELFFKMQQLTERILKDSVIGLRSPVDCIFYDSVMGYVLDVANEVGVPVIYFRTISASSFWTYFCIDDLVEAGQLPIKGNDDMDRIITKVPGMETFLRCRDLPSFCRASDIEDTILQFFMNKRQRSTKAHGLILNTFEDLEAPILSQIRTQFPNVYTVGPLHEHLRLKLQRAKTPESYHSSNSIREVDNSCMSWLDSQPLQSVLYVSFGSVAMVERDQLLELWHGIVNSKKRFLWVMRPGMLSKGDGLEDKDVPLELLEGTKERGYMVGWAPQEEVLAHKAVGGFLTHSGWNSTLESIVAGVPMICWPCLADQQINSRCVEAVWKLGLDTKDVCDRRVVEKRVNDLMVNRREEFLRSTAGMADLARKSVGEGGSSSYHLDRLIEDVRLMTVKGTNN